MTKQIAKTIGNILDQTLKQTMNKDRSDKQAETQGNVEVEGEPLNPETPSGDTTQEASKTEEGKEDEGDKTKRVISDILGRVLGGDKEDKQEDVSGNVEGPDEQKRDPVKTDSKKSQGPNNEDTQAAPNEKPKPKNEVNDLSDLLD